MFKFLKKTDDTCKLFAPVNGKVINLEHVPDKVFASKMRIISELGDINIFDDIRTI